MKKDAKLGFSARENIVDAVFASSVILGGRVAMTIVGLKAGGPEIAGVATLATGVVAKGVPLDRGYFM